MLKVVLAKSSDDAAKVAGSSPGPWVAIETEYGNNSLNTTHPNVELALNHHGEFQKRDAPALIYKQKLQTRYDDFIVSHIDLDVLFGILWTAGWLKKTKTTIELSNLVAAADTDGFHTIKPKLERVSSDISQKYYAIGYLVNSWIINDNGKNVKDISKEVHKLLLRIKDIILDGVTQDQIDKYQNWFMEQEKVAKLHLRQIKPLCSGENLFVYRAPFRLTTAYSIGDIDAKVIVQYSEQSKSISLSCFDADIAIKYFGENGVIEPLKKYFGNDAGGKLAVGGTSRSHDVQPEMLPGFVDFLFREYFNMPEVTEIESSELVVDRKLVTITDPKLITIHEGLKSVAWVKTEPRED